VVSRDPFATLSREIGLSRVVHNLDGCSVDGATFSPCWPPRDRHVGPACRCQEPSNITRTFEHKKNGTNKERK
jgi:hypothetical protein